MDRLALPTTPAPDCRGCGACCEVVGAPPGYAAFFAPDLHPPGSGVWDSEDYRHFLSAPEAAREQLADYYAAVDRGEVADRSFLRLPCLWYGGPGRGCRHYEHRPAVCRAFRAGSVACLYHRGRAGW